MMDHTCTDPYQGKIGGRGECRACIIEEHDNRPALKVYLVTVDPPMWSDGGTSNQEVVVLALEEETAFESAMEELGTFEPDKARTRTDIVEIKGPFTNGSVLHRC